MKKTLIYGLGVIIIIAIILGVILYKKKEGFNEGKWFDIYTNMRKLWTDHVVWTRLFIIAEINNTFDKQTTTERLLNNQKDIGNFIAGVYGRKAGDITTQLLTEHILIAKEITDNAMAHQNIDGLVVKWYENGDRIAQALSSLNKKWRYYDLRNMMNVHLETTTNELKAYLSKNPSESITSFDMVYNHILKMSDYLSYGLK